MEIYSLAARGALRLIETNHINMTTDLSIAKTNGSNARKSIVIDRDNNDDTSISTKVNPKQPLVAKISLWTTRTKLNPNMNQTNDNDSDSDTDSDTEETDFEMDDNAQLELRLKQANLPEYVRKVATKELQKLKKTPNFLSDHAITRGYLELIADLPWNEETNESIDIQKSRRDLDEDHYGMQKLKERVLQYLAVRKLKYDSSSTTTYRNSQPILLFVGPPGTGKTSIAQSIANSLGRKFQRISLGGVADQSSIRGHRRTYIGAMPGRILQGIKAAGVNNPVFLLDEVDKMSAGAQGDPSGALLEVLDPEQNHTFTDHYLNLAFDLSKVLFIATANTLDTIPSALLDRMEVIQIAGYTHEEKFNIAKRHLLPKQVRESGLKQDSIVFKDEAIDMIITNYAREAGVRNLERRLATVCRVVAVRIVDKQQNTKTLPIIIDADSVESYLGPMIYERENNTRASVPGVAIGLAWTAAGGEITFVESEIMLGSPKREALVLTGQLGSVMRESAHLALNWIRANFHRYELLPATLGRDLIENTVHIHFPAGAVGKDGPSAGVTVVVSLMSLCSNISVVSDLAMTGEITLRGIVLKVGGVKSKVLAAHRAGIRRVILPAKNEPDLAEVTPAIREKIKFYFVHNIDDVIKIAFDGKLQPRASPGSPSMSIDETGRSLTSKL